MSPRPKEIIVIKSDSAAIRVVKSKGGAEFPVEGVFVHQVIGIKSKRCVTTRPFRDLYFLIEEVGCFFQKFGRVRCLRLVLDVENHLIAHNIRMDHEERGGKK